MKRQSGDLPEKFFCYDLRGQGLQTYLLEFPPPAGFSFSEDNWDMFFLYGIKDIRTQTNTDQRVFSFSDEFGKELINLGITDFCFLNTCHRAECYWSSEDTNSIDSVRQLVLKKGVPDNDLFYFKSGPAAIEHLFRISSGLDTLVLGEYEILGQIKQNLQQAKILGSRGLVTDVVFKAALAIGRKVRRETNIARGKTSYASLIVDLIHKTALTNDLSKVLIVGTGKLARELGNLLFKSGFRLHFVAGRDLVKAQKLAADFGGDWIPETELTSVVSHFSFIVGVSGAKKILLTAKSLKNLKQPLTIIDLSTPSIVDANARNNSLINLIDINQVIESLQDNLEKRAAEIGKVELLVAEAVEDTVVLIRQNQKRYQFQSVCEELLHEGQALLTNMLTTVNDPELKLELTNLWNQQLQKLIHFSIIKEKYESLPVKGETNHFFPIVLSLKEQQILVVGGGKVAFRKITKLLEANAKIRIIAPRLRPELEELVREGRILWKKGFYRAEALNGITIVIAATDDPELNRKIAAEAREKRILVNTVNEAESSDFIFPAQIRRGDLIVAVSTSGKEPRVARELREELERLFNDFSGAGLKTKKEFRIT